MAREGGVPQLKKYSLAAGERSQAVKVEAILFERRRVWCRTNPTADWGGEERPARGLGYPHSYLSGDFTPTAVLSVVLDRLQRALSLFCAPPGHLPTLNVPSHPFLTTKIRYP